MKPDFFDEIELDAVADNTEDVLDSIYNIAFVFVFNGKDYEEKYRKRLVSIISIVFTNYEYEITTTIFHNGYAYITINLNWTSYKRNNEKNMLMLIRSYGVPFCRWYILNNKSVLFKFFI